MTNSPDNLNNDTTSNSAVNQSTSNSADTEYAGESTQVIALVCGIVGLFVSFVGVVALVLGIQARKESKRTGKPVSDMMKAAFVLGIIDVALLIASLFAILLIFIFVVGSFSAGAEGEVHQIGQKSPGFIRGEDFAGRISMGQ